MIKPVQRIELFALQSRLGLRVICARLAASLHSSRFELGAENETEWGEASVGPVVINVSCPYEDGTLRGWDASVPEGCNVGISIGLPKDQPYVEADWSRTFASLADAIATALGTKVVHHRTWTAG